MFYLWLRIYVLIYGNISKIFQNSIIISLRILTLCSLLLLLSSFLLNIWGRLFRMFYLALHILHTGPIQHSFLIFGNRFWIYCSTFTITLTGLIFFSFQLHLIFTLEDVLFCFVFFSFYPNSILMWSYEKLHQLNSQKHNFMLCVH